MRPEVIVNCAMSADGKIAGRERRQVKISDEEDFGRVHELRNGVDGIIVGVETVIADDPSLLVKEKYVPIPSQPVRIIIDPHMRTPGDSLVLDGSADTIIFTTERYQREIEGAEVLAAGVDHLDLEEVLKILHEKGFKSVLVEGGGETIWHFMEKGFADRFRVFIGSTIIGGKTSPTPVDGNGFGIGQHIRLELKSIEKTPGGVILEYEVKN